jgi:hypothetical protein
MDSSGWTIVTKKQKKRSEYHKLEEVRVIDLRCDNFEEFPQPFQYDTRTASMYH